MAKLISKGLTYKEVANDLQRSPATVRNQARAVYDKLKVSNVAGVIEALRIAW